MSCNEAKVDDVARLMRFLYCQPFDGKDGALDITRLYLLAEEWGFSALKQSAASRLDTVLSNDLQNQIFHYEGSG